VGIFYLAALIVGAGTIVLQLVLSGDGGAEAHADVDGDAHFDADTDAATGHDAGHADSGVLPIFLSVRFWTFGLLAFGLVGTLLHFFHLASAALVPLIAVGMGLGSGFSASWVFRALGRAELSSGVSGGDAVGQVGRVLLPVMRGGRGKVRVEIRGQILDFLATTDDEHIAAGDRVLIEELRGDTAHVSPAPPDFLPPHSEKPRLS
jgi:membrane protein implicated in regulation of membrane protease activity